MMARRDRSCAEHDVVGTGWVYDASVLDVGPLAALAIIAIYLAIPILIGYTVVRLAIRHELARRDRERGER
jgi:hypothetical protein